MRENNSKGITLIALVITIIVMLILVAVTISMAINGGLFEKAGEATGKTKNEIRAEQRLADGRIKVGGSWYASIDDYLNNNPIKTGIVVTPTEITLTKVQKGAEGEEKLTEIITASVFGMESEPQITWEISSNAVTLSATTGNSVTVTAAGTSNAEITVTAKCTYEGKEYTATSKITLEIIRIKETYSITEKDANGMLTDNAIYVSGDYAAVIPKGFAVVPGLNGTTTIADGLVITDELDEEGNSIGNEFVWIPVEVTDTDTETSIASFYRSGWKNNERSGMYTATSGYSFCEPFTSGYSGETIEYNEMLKSVYENGGFYIGRYEAGSLTARTNVANETTEMVVKRDAYPYNYVGWGDTVRNYSSSISYNGKLQGDGALALSKSMYTGKDVGATSTLCYGIQWDAMLDFIKDDNHNVNSGTTWGNHSDSAWTITRKSARYTSSPSSDTTWSLIDDEYNDSKKKTSSQSFLLTTGASDGFAAKNIYDVAGNVREWTNEAISGAARVWRGRGYNSSGENGACERQYDETPMVCNAYMGFRPVLYISLTQ